MFGYNGRDVEVSARNLWTLKSGAVLYSAGAIAVVLERSKGTGADTQRHYTEHTDDIECMELHPEGDIVASGQRAGLTPHSGAHIRCEPTGQGGPVNESDLGCENSHQRLSNIPV